MLVIPAVASRQLSQTWAIRRRSDTRRIDLIYAAAQKPNELPKRHERSNSLLRWLRVDRYRFRMPNDYFVALPDLVQPLYVLIDVSRGRCFLRASKRHRALLIVDVFHPRFHFHSIDSSTARLLPGAAT